jgi:hypothetical protein
VDAVTDPKAFRQSGQGFLIPLKTGHLPNEIQRITAPDLPASMIELSRGLSEDITKISGVNEELLGAATDDKAALLSMMRQGAGLTTLQTIFDKADYSLRLLGKLNFCAIRKNYSKGKISAILGKEPNERFFDASSMKFDICVEEGCYSTTQRQLELQQKLYFREIGLPIAPEDIVKSAFISDKKTIIENMVKSQQQQQQQAQQAQEAQQKMAEQQLNADMMKAYAEAKMKIADASVKTASIASQAMRTENESQAIEYDNAKKELEMVKLIMELEEVDRQGIRSALNLVDQIKISVTPPPIGESVAPSALQSMAV